MTRLIVLLTSLVLFSSGTTPKIELDGVWILVYGLADSNNPEPVHLRNLMDFKNDTVSLISVGDPSTGDLGKVQIEKFKFKLKMNESVIAFAGGKAKLSYTSDSLILQSKRDSKLVFKRLDSKLRTKSPMNNCFNGAYVIITEEYQDSICFINDSTLIHTGDNNINFPAKKWNIVTYKGFQFLNIQDNFNPLTVIKSCTPDKITLVYYYQKEVEFALKPYKASISRERLIGHWTEIRSSTKPPTPPNLEEKDQYYTLTLDQDSILIEIMGRYKKLKWDITKDGKRIYFSDKIFKEDGSWKLLDLTDSTMTFRESRYGGQEEIIKLKRDANGR